MQLASSRVSCLAEETFPPVGMHKQERDCTHREEILESLGDKCRSITAEKIPSNIIYSLGFALDLSWRIWDCRVPLLINAISDLGEIQTTLRLSDLSLRRPFFQSLLSLLSLSLWRERFFSAGSVPQANLQTLMVSVTAVKSVQCKRTGEKESCVSHRKIWGCCEGKLKACCVLEWGQTVLQVAGSRDTFCWILLFHQGKIHLDFRNLGVSETTSPPVCSGVCGYLTKTLTTPPNALLLPPPGSRLSSTELLSFTEDKVSNFNDLLLNKNKEGEVSFLDP